MSTSRSQRGVPELAEQPADTVPHDQPDTHEATMATLMHDDASLEAAVARLTARLTARLDEQALQVARLEADNAALRDRVRTLEAAPVAARVPSRASSSASAGLRRRGRSTVPTSRRRLLQWGGVAAAGVAAGALSLANSGPVAHASSTRADSVTFQTANTGDGNIAIEGDGAVGADGVHGTSDTGTGVSGSSTNWFGVDGISETSFGVIGQSISGTAVFGDTFTNGGPGDGVRGAAASGSGVSGSSTSGVGGWFSAGRAQLHLDPAGSAGAPTTGLHFTGDLFMDSAGTLWLCTIDGTPGTWGRLAVVSNGRTGGAINFLSTPVRLLETRPGFTDGATNKGSPLTSSTTFSFPVAGKGGIPTIATGVLGTITALSPTHAGNIKFWPAGASQPGAVALVASTAPADLASFTMSGLGSGGQVSIIFEGSSGSTCNVVFDAVGFTR